MMGGSGQSLKPSGTCLGMVEWSRVSNSMTDKWSSCESESATSFSVLLSH